nr:MAG TPA: hypothetical protein [Caudoviricetes sp.]
MFRLEFVLLQNFNHFISSPPLPLSDRRSVKQG